jgi:hypothetical protein
MLCNHSHGGLLPECWAPENALGLPHPARRLQHRTRFTDTEKPQRDIAFNRMLPAMPNRRSPVLLRAAGELLARATAAPPRPGTQCGRHAAPAQTAAARPNGRPSRRRSMHCHGATGKKCHPGSSSPSLTTNPDRHHPAVSGGANPGTTRQRCRAYHEAPTGWRGSCRLWPPCPASVLPRHRCTACS